MKRTKKVKNIIAIDPDVQKSGVAFLEVATRKLEVTNLRFPSLLDYLQFAKKQGDNFIVVIEAGWLNNSHWHVNNKDSKAVVAAKGNSVGRNHETGRKIVEMCKHYGIEVVEQRPLKKMWKGGDKKITHDEFASITGILGRTTQDARDAGLIAWIYAGLPIRVGVL